MPKDTKPTTRGAGKASGRSAISDVVAREYTIHLHKRVRSHLQHNTAQHQFDEVHSMIRRAASMRCGRGVIFRTED